MISKTPNIQHILNIRCFFRQKYYRFSKTLFKEYSRRNIWGIITNIRIGCKDKILMLQLLENELCVRL